MKQLVWLDCDPGHDDAFAMVLAGYDPHLELLGISNSHGNQTHEKTLRNAALFAKAAGLTHIKIVPGQEKPIMRQPLTAPDIHGESGLDGMFNMPPVDPEYILQGEKAVIHLAQVLEQSPQKVNLVATGPLTNYALLLALYPEIKTKIEKIVFMGGAIGSGNWTPTSEFNILVDPEAAHMVINSGLPVYMVPLEVTHQVIVTDNIISEMNDRLEQSEFCRLMTGPPLHDPCAVAYLIMPEIFSVKPMHVEVVTADGNTLGQTVCDVYNKSPIRNVHVALDIDQDAFFEVMLRALSLANDHSPMNQYSKVPSR